MSAENRDPAIELYLREIGRVPLLTPEQEMDLAVKIKHGDREARLHMISSNLRLVVRIAGGYVNLGLPFLDVISDGSGGSLPSIEGRKAQHLCGMVDQAIHHARALESEQDHSIAISLR